MKQIFIFAFLVLMITLFFNNVFAWEPVNGKQGNLGNLFVSTINNKENHIFIGTWYGGIWNSVDFGQNWQIVKSLPENAGAYQIEFSKEKIFIAYPANGVYRSNDLGISWESITKSLQDTININSFSIEDSLIVVLHKTGMPPTGETYLSFDYGETWTDLTNTYPLNWKESWKYISSVLLKDKVIYLCTSNQGVYKSSDYGKKWEQSAEGILPDIYDSTKTSHFFNIKSIQNSIYANSNYHLYNYDEIKKDWHVINNSYFKNQSIKSFDINGDNIIVGLDSSWSNGGSVSSESRVIITKDKGINWKIVSKNLPKSLIGSVKFVNNRILIGFRANYTPVFYSDDFGETWNTFSNLMSVESPISFLSLGNELFSGTEKKIFKYDENKEIWRNTFSGSSWDLPFYTLSNINDRIFAANVLTDINPGLWYSDDIGNSWVNIGNIPTQRSGYRIFTSDRNLFAASTNAGVYFSSDKGANWSERFNGLGNSQVLWIDGIGSDLCAGTNESGIFLSYDLGLNWIQRNSGLGTLKFKQIKYLNENTIIAGSIDDGIYISKDKGLTWTQKNNGLLSKLKVNSIITEGNNIIIGCSSGVLISSDVGESWVAKNDGFGSTNVWSLYKFKDYLYCGIYGNGVWRAKLIDIITSVKDNSQENQIELYPNPTSEMLTISNIPDGALNFEIFDNLGQIIESGLMNGEIDVSMLTPGIYFIKIGTQPPLKFVKL